MPETKNENRSVVRRAPGTPVRTVRRKEQTRADKFLRFTKRFFTQFGTAIIAVAVVAYVFLQLILNIGPLIEFENASYVSISRRAELTAYLFRDESVIPAEEGGIDCFLVSDGEKVRKGEEIAITYTEPSDAEKQRRINEIDSRIKVLERSRVGEGAATMSVSALDESIDSVVLDMVRDIDDNALDKALRSKDELLILLNRRNALIHSVGYDAELSKLNSEKETLASEITGEGSVTEAPGAGYFYSSVDGYENIFTLAALWELTCEAFDRLSSSVPDQDVISSSCGKMVYGSTWYIAVGMDKRTAELYRDGRQYAVTFQYSNNTVIRMTLERRLNRTDADQTVMIFSTRQLPDGFDYSRCQTVEVVRNEYSGLRISASALRVVDGVTGVYVVQGSKVVFKTTEVLYSYGGYCVCAVPTDPNYPDETDIAYHSKTRLSLHDAVITEGSGLYDGMRLT